MEGKLGDLLRGAREGKGLSLAKAEQGTRIRQRYLQALEEGDYAALPEPVYVKGFLRNYAAFLGLNAEEILDQYYGERGLRSRDVAEVREQIHPLPRPSRMAPILLTIFVPAVLFIAFASVLLYSQLVTSAPAAPGTPTVPILLPTPSLALLPGAGTATPVATRIPTPVQDIRVPNVVGMNLQDADAALKRLDLRIEVVDRVSNTTVAAGVVVSQSVPSGAAAKSGAVVGVVLSRGSQAVAVPRLVGLSYNDAAARVQAAGLKVQRVEVSAQGAPDSVVGQDPAENSQVPAGTVVRITVSVGDVLVVPDVRGMSLDRAKDALLKAGLVVGQVSFQGKDKLGEAEWSKWCSGCVVSTDPSIGRVVKRGAVINIGVRSD